MLPVSESVKSRLKLCVDSDIQVGVAPYALITTSDIPLGLSPSLMSLELSYARGISKLSKLRKSSQTSRKTEAFPGSYQKKIFD